MFEVRLCIGKIWRSNVPLSKTDLRQTVVCAFEAQLDYAFDRRGSNVSCSELHYCKQLGVLQLLTLSVLVNALL